MSDKSQKPLDLRLADLQRDIDAFLQRHQAFPLEKVEANNIVDANLQIYPIIQRDLRAYPKEDRGPVEIMFDIQMAHYRPDIENPALWKEIYTTMPETTRFLQTLSLSLSPGALENFNTERQRFQSDILRYISGEIQMSEALSRAVGTDAVTLQELRTTSIALQAEQQQQSQQ